MKEGFWRWFANKHFGIVLGAFCILIVIGILLFFVYVVPVIANIIEIYLPDIVILITLSSILVICISLLCLSFWWEYQDDMKKSCKDR